MQAYQTLGDQEIKQEFTEAHCKHLEQWYNSDGDFIYPGTPPSSREMLWNCFSLLAHGDQKYLDLAGEIILKTPIDGNAFTPGAAAELILRNPDRIPDPQFNHLKKIISKHMGNMVDVRLSNNTTNNFSCKTTLLFFAASQIIDHYENQHELATIPQVYSCHRLRDMGLNGLYALAYYQENHDVFGEWNSPTYSPISALGLAGIVELIDNEEAKAIALELELRLWRELLNLYHPELMLPCGPYSRSYRVDILGQNSNIKMLMIYLGLSKEKSLVKQFDVQRPGLFLHHSHDIPFNWSQQAWDIAGEYHLPTDALEELQSRNYPHKFSANIDWCESGYIEEDRFFPVQGNLYPGGEGKIFQVQEKNYSIGYRTDCRPRGHCFPAMFHYATKDPVKEMDDVRNVTLGVLFYDQPVEWEEDADGRKVDAGNFNNVGKVLVEGSEDGKKLSFTGTYYSGFSPVPTDELSFNSFIPLHFGDIDNISMNGNEFSGKELFETASEAVFQVKDAGFEYEISYSFDQEVKIKLYRWCNFVRIVGFWYSGDKKLFTPEELEKYQVQSTFKILKSPDCN